MEYMYLFFFFQAEDGIRDGHVTGVQTCALPISNSLCVAVIDEPLALTKSADIEFTRASKLGDKVISKAVVEKMDGNTAIITVTSRVEQKLVFKGRFEMYYTDETDEGEKNG